MCFIFPKMLLRKRLLSALDNKEESIAKRLKLAENAFHSHINLPNKEMLLLKWGAKCSLTNVESLQQCYAWVDSEKFRALNVCDVTYDDLQAVINSLDGHFSSTDKEVLNRVVRLLHALCDRKVYKTYFRNNIEAFFQIISKLIHNIQDVDILLKFLSHDKLFNNKITTTAHFHDSFIKMLIPTFVEACRKFPSNNDLHIMFTSLISKFVFAKKEQQFDQVLKEQDKNHILDLLFPICSTSNLQQMHFQYNLVFDAFCKSFKTAPKLILSMYAHILTKFHLPMETIGESSLNLQDSLFLVAGTLEILSSCQLPLGTLDDTQISLPNVMKHLLVVTVSCPQHQVDASSFKILNHIIDISPLTIDTNLNSILTQFMQHSGTANEEMYAQLLCNILQVFHKLHRLEKFVSKLIRGLQPFYVDNCEEDDVELNVERILPQIVLEKFSEYTLSLSSKQVTNLFRTFVFHLDELIESSLSEDTKEKSVTFIEIICTLLCHFLSKLNVSTSTYRQGVEEKYATVMGELEDVLSKFGSILVGIQHKQSLMHTFLNLCYTHGELKIVLNYIISPMANNQLPEFEVSPCDVSFLHNYLPSNIWCLLAERVCNFGENVCKEIMVKVCLQKLRVLELISVDKANITEHIHAFLKMIMPIEHYYKYLINDTFAMNAILPHIESRVVEKFADEIISSHETLVDNEILANALLQSTLKRINKIMKKENREMSSCKVFAGIMQLFDVDNEAPEDLRRIVAQAISSGNNERLEKHFNDAQISKLLRILTQLPITYMNRFKQQLLFAYLLFLFMNMKQDADESANLIEILLRGVLQCKGIDVEQFMETKQLLHIIVQHFINYKQIFASFLNTIANCTEQLQSIIQSLTEQLTNVRYVNCFVIILQFAQKNKIAAKLLQHFESIIVDCFTVDINNPEMLNALSEFAPYVHHDDEKTRYFQIVLHHATLAMKKDVNELNKDELSLILLVLQNRTILLTDTKSFSKFLKKVTKILTLSEFKADTIRILAKLFTLYLNIADVELFKSTIDTELHKTISSFEKIDELKLHFDIWNQILTLTVQNDKVQHLQVVLQHLVMDMVEREDPDDQFSDLEIDFVHDLLNNKNKFVTPLCLDLCFTTISRRMKRTTIDTFERNFLQSVRILDAMVNCRKAQLYDRLPVFFQYYRILVDALCDFSDANCNYPPDTLNKLAGSAHLLEKLTIRVCKLNKHIASIAVFPIFDILHKYETVTICPSVKMALEKCLFNLMPLCSSYSISFFLRLSTPASSELFKETYNNFKKYHSYRGKV